MKRRMQQVRFRSVGEMLDTLPEDQLVLTERLREIVMDTLPEVREHLAYNVPYYKRHANICFIWPGAVPWGSKIFDGVRFGFTRGYLLSDEMAYLEKGSRKQVYWRDMLTPRDIRPEVLIPLLAEACEIDEAFHRRHRRV